MNGGLASLVLLAVVVAAIPAAAQPPIDPDRPDASTGTSTVPRGSLQLESGLAHERTSLAGEDERRLSVEAMARIGITDRLELRLEGEPFVRLRGEQDDTDHGDLTISIKYRVLDAGDGRPALGVVPFVKVPLAGEPIGTERPDLGLIGLAVFDLPAEVDLTLNAGIALLGQQHPHGYRVQGLLVTGVQRDLASERLLGFAELFFNTPEEHDGDDVLGVQIGVVYRVTRRLALDAAVQTALLGRGPDYGLRAGVSVRFGR